MSKKEVVAEGVTTNAQKSVIIFYAWQGDLPFELNKRLIRRCLKLASIELEKKLFEETGVEYHLVVDDATRGLPGSPNIPDAIAEKIPRADIFVGDLSTINTDCAEATKKTPNPNVTFELGFASSKLGWDRIIMLVNEAFGPLGDLPFDFDRRRASGYTAAPQGQSAENALKQLLITALGLIIRNNPVRPGETTFDSAQEHRKRDLSNLRWFLRCVNWSVIDQHIASGAKYLTTASAFMRDEAAAIIGASVFHIYDLELRDAIEKFVEHWGKSIQFDHYEPLNKGDVLSFRYSRYPDEQAIQQKHWAIMDVEREHMRGSADHLLTLIRDNYPEIDVQSESDAAGVRYSE